MYAQPRLRLKAVDENGIELKQVAAGKPWFLELLAEGVHATKIAPAVAGLDGFDVRKQSTQMNMINGVATFKQIYRIVIEHPGNYNIGPAEIKEQDTDIVSPALIIRVGEQEMRDARVVAAHKKHIGAKKAILSVATDKENVVVGEQLRLFVRFLYRTKDISLQGIQVATKISGFFVGPQIGPFAGKQIVDSVEYDYLEYCLDLTTQEIGRQIIPVFSADFLQANEENFPGGLAAFFRGFAEKKRIYSSPLAINVNPLPEHSSPVRLVGEFEALRAQVDNPIVREGEGVVLTLEVEGSGNLSTVESLSLQGIPDGFKAYPSKANLVENRQGTKNTKKRFEYILQAVKRGSWEIPAQEITYFDVASQTYKELQSNPIVITVIPNSTQRQSAPKLLESMPADQASPEAQMQESEEEPDILAPICVDFLYYQSSAYCMPWWLFMLFVLLPILGLLYPSINKISGKLSSHYCARWYKHRVWYAARSQLATAERHGNVKALYEIFIMIFVTHFEIPRQEVTQERMNEVLHQVGFSDEERSSWQRFFVQISAEVFAQHTHDKQDHTALFKEARSWIKRLENSR